MLGRKGDAFDLVITQTEVQQHGATGIAVGENDVVGFHIAMHDSAGMARAENCKQLLGRLDRSGKFKAVLRLPPCAQCRSLDERGRDVWLDTGILPVMRIALLSDVECLGRE